MTSDKDYGKDAVSIKEEKEKKMEKINIVEKIGEIKKGGIIQPVYDQIIMREEGGQVMPMQYGGGLSNAYSTLSELLKKQPVSDIVEAPIPFLNNNH